MKDRDPWAGYSGARAACSSPPPAIAPPRHCPPPAALQLTGQGQYQYIEDPVAEVHFRPTAPSTHRAWFVSPKHQCPVRTQKQGLGLGGQSLNRQAMGHRKDLHTLAGGPGSHACVSTLSPSMTHEESVVSIQDRNSLPHPQADPYTKST